ncbi:MAG: bifunctional UDP-N-acetylglucosamine diphosphorylase/glucosamine-1-phosphate N-acetyltransferase GlmU [Leucothrix sp.]
MNIKSIILAAGKGSRMRSDLPKVMHEIGGKAMLHHVVLTCESLGEGSIIGVVGHHAEAVIASFPSDASMIWVRQEEQLGTGHAVMQAVPQIEDEDIVLIAYGDVPLVRTETLKPLCECIGEHDYALLTTTLDNPAGYGRIVRNANHDILKIVEEKDASESEKQIQEINTGIVAAKGVCLKRWLAKLTNDNAQQEYYLTDCVAHAVSEGASITSVDCADPNEIQGVNDRKQQAMLERAYQALQAERLMAEGATLIDPTRLDVRGEVSVGKDVLIDINAVFIGNVSMGDNVIIGPNCVIQNASIASNVTIKANSVIESAEIGDGCDVGPFARIRPGTRLAKGAKVGNFVEIKKSLVGEGSKVSHLSYVGDTDMGANVNIGAGTITCNYDGVNKFKTTIGDDVFVGSDTQLIAPVTIGEGTTIGAGSTISKDTPAQQLTLSRAKQVSIPSWVRPQKSK